MAPNDLVLITGASGHIGFRTLIFALKAGYRVRAAVRSSLKADTILTNPTLKALNLPESALSFVTIADLTAPGAHDDAVKGVTYIIHVASPIPSAHLTRDPSEAEEIFIRPAVQGTLGLLSSAQKEPGVRRVVVTSSTVALLPTRHWAAIVPPPKGAVYGPSDRVETPKGPYPTLPAAYCASKIASLNESEAWVAREKPGFGLVNVHPSFVLGRDDLHLTVEGARAGTNMMALSIALGAKSDAQRVGAAVHVDDVARVQVGALDEEKVAVEGTRSFITNTDADWQDVTKVVKSDYAAALEKGLLKDDGTQPTMPMAIDVSETEKVFGFKHASFEEQVRSVIGHYVELHGSA